MSITRSRPSAIGGITFSILTLAYGACGSRDAPNGSPGRAAAVIQEYRFGSIDQPDALTGIPIHGLALGPDNTIYIAQPQFGEVRIHTPQGQHRRTVGRKGSGPAEFTSLTSIGVVGDTLYAINMFPGRVSFLTLAGEHIETVPFAVRSLADDYVPTAPYLLFRDGSGIVSPGYHAEAGASTAHVSYLRVDQLGHVIDSLYSFPAQRTSLRIGLDGGGVLSISMPAAFSDYPIVAFSADGARMVVVERYAAASAKDTAFTVTAMSLTGDTLYARSYGYTPAAVPHSVSAAAVSRTAREVAGVLGARERAEQLISELLAARTHYPPVATAILGSDHSLWLRREVEEGAMNQRWEVHDPAGVVRETVYMPTKFEPRWIDGDIVWGVETDEFDVPYVVRYRVLRDISADQH